jgi:hypothetical protein
VHDAGFLYLDIKPASILLDSMGRAGWHRRWPGLSLRWRRGGCCAGRQPRRPRLDDQERRRLAEATQRAYGAEINESTVYTVERTKTQTAQAPGQPTIVAAKPVGPRASRPDGSSCQPIELTATKNGQTTWETTTFCQAAGSSELKPVSV